MTETILAIFTYFSFLTFTAKRLLVFLHALQQEDYDNTRLLRWVVENRVFDKRLSAALFICGLAAFIAPDFVILCLIFFVFAATAYFEKDPRTESKKKLVLTQRAKRIVIPAIAIAGLAGLANVMYPSPWLWIPLVQLVPVFLVLSNLLLAPYEKSIQKKFYDEAQAKLAEYNPTIIGITGSYGKTSVKHILGHILKSAAPTLVTPGSVNTLMGITRIIREQLTPNHKFFVVEMGAYGPGSIEKLCALTPPDAGIITAIGHAHYERFKTLETVAHAKYELAHAVLRKKGTVIVHEKTLNFLYTRAMQKQNQDSFVVCGENTGKKTQGPDLDLVIQKIEQTRDGLIVSLDWKGANYVLEAPLYGLHHGHNIAQAFATAVSLGVSPKDIEAALKRTPQIQHRLEVKKQPGNGMLIDDAYNSNPEGFRAALDLLPVLKTEKARTILVTPGMVELGKAHDEEHEKLGRHAAQTCDIAILVNPERIKSFIKGFQEEKTGKPLIKFDTFAQAEDWLVKNRQDGDIVLLENDLPDIYEQVPKL